MQEKLSRRELLQKLTEAGLKEGKQTRITPIVQEFASQFQGPPSLSLVQEIVDFFHKNFSEKALKLKGFSRTYARRTAEKIISSREIHKLKTQQTGLQSSGCLDYAVAICPVLRAKGIPAWFTRIGTHSYTIFLLNKKAFICEPTRKGAPVREVTAVERRLYQAGKKRKTFKTGKDAWGIGIKSIRQFHKYAK